MNVLYLAGREHSYTRNDVLLRALQRLGTVQVIGSTESGSVFWRSIILLIQGLPRLLARHYDLVFVGFYGHLLMLPVGLLSHSPVLFDAFISTYDTLCFDRQVFAPQSLAGRLAFWLDQTSCRLATAVLLDTPLQADYFAQTFDLAQDKLYSLPIGCNEDIFSPRPTAACDDVTDILYYSTYQPLHGVETVVRAAALLQSERGLRFRLIGQGPKYVQVRELANELNLQNVTFMSFVALKTLANEIAAADICLGGPFGRTDKAARVIPGKIYQILAMARPLIAANTPANRALLYHAETAYLCAPDSPDALASAILKLHQDVALCQKIARAGRALYLERCSEAIITEHLRGIIGKMIK